MYTAFSQHYVNEQQSQSEAAAAIAATVLAAQTLSVNTPPPSVDSSVVSAISPFDIAKNALLKALSEAVEEQSNNKQNASYLDQDYELAATTNVIKPLAKRLKLSDSVSKSTSTLNHQVGEILNKSKTTSELNSLPISAATSLINLHFNSNTNADTILSLPCASPPLPPTPTRSMSIASSSVSSTQNSPISLRRNSSASTSNISNNKSLTTTPQRRPAAPIPENLKVCINYICFLMKTTKLFK